MASAKQKKAAAKSKRLNQQRNREAKFTRADTSFSFGANTGRRGSGRRGRVSSSGGGSIRV